MADPGVIVVVGAGPAGVRAAQALVEAGLRPMVIDEGERAGGQIYRRPPEGFVRPAEQLYGADAAKARDLHDSFARLGPDIDYRPRTLAWAVRENTLHLIRDGVSSTVDFSALILATGATDRLAPLPGWTLPGCFTLGGSQVALKAQACSIGARPVFMGTGPLLYLVAYQYLKAGVDVAAVLDTAPFGAQVRAARDLAVRPGLLARGMLFRARLMAAGVTVANGITLLAVEGPDEVTAVRYRTAGGEVRRIACDAVGMGYHLRSESQLADLAGCPFVFDADTQAWRPEADRDGRSPRAGIYLAGDGARILGADAAEAGGRLAALALLVDRSIAVDQREIERLRTALARFDRFRRGLSTAFPWPVQAVAATDDAVMVCRCEGITAGDIRAVATDKDAPELNRAKALSRIGMGRCQGRFCGSAAAEILAAVRGVPLQDVGRLRGAAPVKPLTMAAMAEPDA